VLHTLAKSTSAMARFETCARRNVSAHLLQDAASERPRRKAGKASADRTREMLQESSTASSDDDDDKDADMRSDNKDADADYDDSKSGDDDEGGDDDEEDEDADASDFAEEDEDEASDDDNHLSALAEQRSKEAELRVQAQREAHTAAKQELDTDAKLGDGEWFLPRALLDRRTFLRLASQWSCIDRDVMDFLLNAQRNAMQLPASLVSPARFAVAATQQRSSNNNNSSSSSSNSDAIKWTALVGGAPGLPTVAQLQETQAGGPRLVLLYIGHSFAGDADGHAIAAVLMPVSVGDSAAFRLHVFDPHGASSELVQPVMAELKSAWKAALDSSAGSSSSSSSLSVPMGIQVLACTSQHEKIRFVSKQGKCVMATLMFLASCAHHLSPTVAAGGRGRGRASLVTPLDIDRHLASFSPDTCDVMTEIFTANLVEMFGLQDKYVVREKSAKKPKSKRSRSRSSANQTRIRVRFEPELRLPSEWLKGVDVFVAHDDQRQQAETFPTAVIKQLQRHPRRSISRVSTAEAKAALEEYSVLLVHLQDIVKNNDNDDDDNVDMSDAGDRKAVVAASRKPWSVKGTGLLSLNWWTGKSMRA
jgi:hypothetical protein